MSVYSQAEASQHKNSTAHTGAHASAEPTTLLWGTCFHGASFTSAFQSLYSSQSEVSSVRLDSTDAVLFSLGEGVWRRRGPLWGSVLLLRSTFSAAATERGAEAWADRLSEQNKHDAVGRSLRRVADALEGQSIECPLINVLQYISMRECWFNIHSAFLISTI